MKKRFFRLLSLFSAFFLIVLLPMSASASSVSAPAPVIISFPDPVYIDDFDFTGYVCIVPFDSSSIESFVFFDSGVPYLNLLFDSQVLTVPVPFSSFELSPGFFISSNSDNLTFFSLSPFNSSYLAVGGRDSFNSGQLTFDYVLENLGDELYASDASSLYGFFLSVWRNKESLSFFIPSLGYCFVTDPSSYSLVEQGSDLFYVFSDDPQFGLVLENDHWFLMGLLGFLGPSLSVTGTYDFAVSSDSSLLSDLSDTAAAFLGTCGQIADAIVSTPLLLFTVGIFFLGGCVAIFGRFLDKE